MGISCPLYVVIELVRLVALASLVIANESDESYSGTPVH